MGYFRHHAIVVTSSGDHLDHAHAEAVRTFEGTTASVTAPTSAAMNGYRSFLVAPDGSKEGLGESDRAEAAREQFVAWLREHSMTSWVEVSFGGDDADMIGARGPHGRLWGVADDDA